MNRLEKNYLISTLCEIYLCGRVSSRATPCAIRLFRSPLFLFSRGCVSSFRKVDARLPGKGDSNSHGARPVHLFITMIKWIRNSRLSIKNSLSVCSWQEHGAGGRVLSGWGRCGHFTLSLSHTHPLSFVLSLSHTPSLSLFLSLSHTSSLYLVLSLSRTPSLFLSYSLVAGHRKTVLGVAYSPDGDAVATGSLDRTCKAPLVE